MTDIDAIRRRYTTVETWDLDFLEVPHRVKEFDRALAKVRAEAWDAAAERIKAQHPLCTEPCEMCAEMDDWLAAVADNPYRDQP